MATVGVRDDLVVDAIRTMMMVTGSEDDVSVHAALILFVVQEITGLDGIDDLRGQLKDVTDRIVDKMVEESKQ